MDYLKNKRFLVAILAALAIILILLISRYGQFGQGLITKPQPSPPPQKQTYFCPSIPDFCKNGNAVIKDGVYLGFGAQIPANSPIYAVFEGKLTVSQTILTGKNNEQLNTIYLDNGDLLAVYYFIGDTSGEREVKRGEQIGSSINKINTYNTSLIFQILKGDPKKGEKVELTADDFTI